MKKIIGAAMVAAMLMTGSQAALVNVFLDDGSIVPGSTSTVYPFNHLDREVTWDVSATAESGLAAIGAAVMEVQLTSLGGAGAYSYGMTQAGLNGFAVSGGPSGAWFDPAEAAIFHLSFYADAGKTVELTGLDVTFKSVTSRGWTANQAVHAFAAQNQPEWVDNAPVGLGDEDYARMEIPAGGYVNFFPWQDNNMKETADYNLMSVGAVGDNYWSTAYGTDAVVFGEGDTFWLRRENLSGQAAAAYQLGAVTFDVIPEPATLGLFGLLGSGLLFLRKRFSI